MKTIDITTSQNVTVSYGLATVWERGVALGLDMLFITITGYILYGFLNLIFDGNSLDVMTYIIVIPFVLFYSLAFESLNHGQSPGKKILKIRIIRLDGERTNFMDYMMRWMFRALDIYGSFTGVGLLSIISSKYSQRLGDLLANTVVVNVGKTERFRLENLFRLNKMAEHELTYPQVIKMPEEAMIVLKDTLTKQRALDNTAHDEAMELLVKKMEKELDIKAKGDAQTFLRTLLKDYIVLTR